MQLIRKEAHPIKLITTYLLFIPITQSPIPSPHYPLSPEGAPSSPIPITPYPQRGPRVPQSPVPNPDWGFFVKDCYLVSHN
ncbi:hypothetical protein FDUTEX481_07653 [Tolypothrix sp. PCC 7601]|nr:hypothetical protein FDUTEX481_07653 [Tolypothrix sp. PCC 7601]